MPFGTLHPITPRQPFPPPRSGSVPNHDGAGSTRLDRLPVEILVHVASCAGNIATLRLSQTSRRVHAALQADAAPTQLGHRVRWIASASALEHVLSGVFLLPPSRRPALLAPLIKKASKFPAELRERAYAALQRRHESPEDALHLRLTWPHIDLPALEHIEALPPDSRAPLVPKWIARSGTAALTQRTPAAWMALVHELPAGERLPTLRALCAAKADPEDPLAWQAWPDLQLRVLEAARHIGAAQGMSSPGYATLLNDLARACYKCDLYHHPIEPRLALWDGVFALSGNLPAPARRAVMVSLAHLAELECFQKEHAPRWTALIAAAVQGLDGDALADVLCALMDMDPGYDDRTEPQLPLVEAVLNAAGGLPEGPCARVLASVAEAASFIGEGREDAAAIWEHMAAAIWEHIFRASERLGTSASVTVMRALASSVCRFSKEDAGIRWRALLERAVQTMSPPQLTDALGALAYGAGDARISGGYALLLEASARLPEADRAVVHAAILRAGFSRDIEPPEWRQIVNDMGRMPVGVCVGTIAALARRLLTTDWKPISAGIDPAIAHWPSPSDMTFAEPPTSGDDARNKLSQIVTRLPLGELADLLLDLATRARGHGLVTWIPWFLEQAERLPNIGQHRTAIVTQMAILANRCIKTKQSMEQVNPSMLWNAVLALPLDNRAHALHEVGELFSGLPSSHAEKFSLYQQEAAKLPPLDREPATNKRKRNAAAEGTE